MRLVTAWFTALWNAQSFTTAEYDTDIKKRQHADTKEAAEPLLSPWKITQTLTYLNETQYIPLWRSPIICHKEARINDENRPSEIRLHQSISSESFYRLTSTTTQLTFFAQLSPIPC